MAWPTIISRVFSTLSSGLVPKAPTPAGTTKFLREDGAWSVPSGGGGGAGVQNSLTPASTTLAPSVDAVTGGLAGKSDSGHTHNSGAVSDFTEAVQDVVGSLFVAAGGGYNDAGNSVSFPAGGGATIEVQEGGTTVVATANKLNLNAADFDVVETPAGKANIALSNAIPRILGVVTLTGNATLNAATHGNRLIIVNSASAVSLTLQNDAGGGHADEDFYYVYRQGVGAVTLLAGTATFENTAGMLVATTTNRAFIGINRVRANTWAPSEAAAGSGSSNTQNYFSVGTFAAPLIGGESADLTTLDVGPLTTNGHTIDTLQRWSTGNENTTETQQARLYLNGTLLYNIGTDPNTQAAEFRVLIERLSDTTVRVTPTFNNFYASPNLPTPFGVATVSSLSAGCVLSSRSFRAALQTKTVTLLRLSALAQR